MRGCKSIAEYVFCRWMEANGFINKYFTLEVTGNEAIIKDKTGDTLNLVYDSTEKCVRVNE